MKTDRIILGCANFGGVGSIPTLIGKGDSPEAAHLLLDRARDLGIFRFDTANSYGGGASEKILGDWILKQDSGLLSRLEVATKVGNPFGCSFGKRPLCRDEMELHLKTSLRRLNLERITIYYLHVLDPATPLDETLEALSRAIQEGTIGTFGLSNVTQLDVERVVERAGSSLSRKLSHVQNEFHRLHTVDRDGLIPYLRSKGIRYTAYGPLAGGLTGKYVSPKTPPEGSRLSFRGDSYERFLNDTNLAKIQAWVDEAKARGTNPAAAAIDFILKTAGIDSVILGPRKVEHLEGMIFTS